MPYFSIATRSMPMPNAKPCQTSGSTPTARSTLGWTMPQPRISSQSSPSPTTSSPAAAPAADVHLGGRLGEREVARPEAHRDVVALEEGAHEVGQAALEVAHVGAPVDHQALDLMEHRRVGHVEVAADRCGPARSPGSGGGPASIVRICTGLVWVRSTSGRPSCSASR